MPRHQRIDIATNWLVANAIPIPDICAIIMGYVDGMDGTLLFEFTEPAVYCPDIIALPFDRIASSSRDHTIHIWDLATSTRIYVLDGHTDRISVMAGWSSTADTMDTMDCVAQSRVFVSGSMDRTIRMWDSMDGTCLLVLGGHTAQIACLTRLSNGMLGSGAYDKTIRLWRIASDCAEGECVGIIQASARILKRLPNDQMISSDHTMHAIVRNSMTCELTHQLDHPAEVGQICVMPRTYGANQGTRVVTSALDRMARIWDTVSGTLLCVVAGHRACICAITVMRCGLLVTGSWDCTVRVWDCNDIQTNPVCVRVLQGHTVGVSRIVVLGDGILVSGGFDGVWCQWDISSGRCMEARQGSARYIRSLVALPCHRLVTISGTSVVRVWE